MPSCPSSIWADQTRAVDTGRSLLCVYHETFSATWNNATNDCYNFYSGAHLCSHEEVRRACIAGQGAFTPLTSSWLSTRGVDDQAMWVNIADCNNFDGYQAVGNTLTGKYCCSEWPKY